jgi:sirohydrochlorin ferrochelatase
MGAFARRRYAPWLRHAMPPFFGFRGRTAVKSLIVVAHGSRRAASNAEVQALTDQLGSRLGHRFENIQCAFLEFARPSIPTAIDAAVQAGSSEIVILPYFLASGTHITEHIPTLITAKQTEYPTVIIELKSHIGAAPAMVELLASAV